MDFRSPIALAFFRGAHRDVVRRTVDSPEARVDASELPYVLGALSFLGRLEEAEALFHERAADADGAARAAGRFFLGIGLSRQSRYVEARRYFGANAMESRRGGSALARFFASQGLGFYRYFCGRYGRALVWASRAYDQATRARFAYGRALAEDLRGHALVRTGAVARGIAVLEHAAELSRAFDTTDPAATLAVTLACYRAELGIDSKHALSTLKQLRERLSQEDTYTQSTLLLELGRQLCLRGRYAEAREALEQALPFVIATRNRRHEAALNLHLAHVHWLCGDSHAALGLVQGAKRLLIRDVDRALEVKAIGLELKCLKRLGLHGDVARLESRLAVLTRTLGDPISQRMLARELPHHRSAEQQTARGEDPLGTLLDAIARDRDSAVATVIKRGYWGLLPRLAGIDGATRLLLLDQVPGGLTVIDRDGVRFTPRALTPLTRGILSALAQGPATKESLVRRVWGYRYHPLRHDALVYATVAKLRQALGPHAHWIEASEHGYRLIPQVRILAAETAMPVQTVPAVNASAVMPPPEAVDQPDMPAERRPGAGLNLRQLRILRLARKTGAIDLRTCRKHFRVAAITLSRDLSYLAAQGLLERVGKARATAYLTRDPD